MAKDRHQRHDARAAADQQHRGFAAPDEVGGERPADLDLVALADDVMEVRGDLAVGEPVDGQLDVAFELRRGGDRVGALGRVAVGGREADVVVLAGQMRHPHRQPEAKRLDRRRLAADRLDVAICHLPGARGATRSGFSPSNSAPPSRGRRGCGSRSPPRIRLVVVADPQAGDPLGALPEVEMRDEQPGRAAVLAGQRLALVLGHDPGLAVGQVLDREVGRVAAERIGHRVGVERLGRFEQEVERDAAEAGVELRPLGHAVDVAGHVLMRQLAELLPGPPSLARDHAVDREAPGSSRRSPGSGRRSGRGSRARDTGPAGSGRRAPRGPAATAAEAP